MKECDVHRNKNTIPYSIGFVSKSILRYFPEIGCVVAGRTHYHG